MKRLSYLIVVMISLLISCDYFKIGIHEYYYANLSIRNNCSSAVTDIEIDTLYYMDYLNNDGSLSYTYTDLSIGEQSVYQEVVSGFWYWDNQSTSHYITTLKISYTFEDASLSVIVFSNGLGLSWTSYNILSDEELEKVYLKKDTNNTLVITDDGVELLQGE